VKRPISTAKTALLSTKAATKEAVVADLAACCWSLSDLNILVNFDENASRGGCTWLEVGRQDVGQGSEQLGRPF
jgi:hypothetical protein